MLPPPITEVPVEHVGEVVQEFITNDHVQHLAVDEQSNGKFTVRPIS